VTGNHSDLPALPLRLTPLQILGLRDPCEGDWARLRALQYSQLHRVGLIRALSHGLAALITISIFFGKISAPLLGIWLVLTVTAILNATRIDGRLADIDRRSITRTEFRRQALGVAGCALPWAVALVLFVPHGSQADHFALWTLVAMLIAGSVATMSAAPLGTVVFTAITGLTAIVTFAFGGSPDFAAMTATFIAIAVSGTIE